MAYSIAFLQPIIGSKPTVKKGVLGLEGEGAAPEPSPIPSPGVALKVLNALFEDICLIEIIG